MKIEVENGKIVFKKSYFQQIDDWINKSDDGNTEKQEEIAMQLSDQFEMLSLQGKVTFGFKYCDNAENKLRGRIGKYSGWRTGTRDFKMMPDNKIPKSISKEPTCIRYYDFGRMNWRSFKRTLFVVCSSFFNSKDGKWYDNPTDAGFKNTWQSDNHLGMRNDRPDTKEESEKRTIINKKEQEKRDRQISLTKKKSNLEKSQQYYKLTQNLIKADISDQPSLILKGCLMLNLTTDIWYDILSEIKFEDIYNNESNNFGLEFDPHCTILYGFDDIKIDVDELQSYVQGWLNENSFLVKVSSPSYFKNENYDVLKFGVISNDLETLNNNLKKLFEYENSFSNYIPHITIAYLKPGTAQKYLDLLPIPEFNNSKIVYSDSSKSHKTLVDFGN